MKERQGLQIADDTFILVLYFTVNLLTLDRRRERSKIGKKSCYRNM